VRPIRLIDDVEYPADHPVLKHLQSAFLSDPGELL
jgi:hypothetical protein